MRYQGVEEGIANAVRSLVHNTPEILNPVSAFLIGASGFSSGVSRWTLLCSGVICLLAGTILGRKRDHDSKHEISEYQKALALLEDEKQREQQKVAQLETDNQRERRAMRQVLERLAQELCNEMSWWDETTRVTIYAHIDDGPAPGFLPLARRSANPAFEKRGRAFYKDSEVGYLGTAWEIGEVVHQFKKKTDARDELTKRKKFKMGAITREPAMTREQANSLELTMEPLSVVGIRLDEDNGAIKRGVILFESMEKNKFNNDDKMTLENAQQTESLRIVMVAVSELFHSISITQAAKEASE